MPEAKRPRLDEQDSLEEQEGYDVIQEMNSFYKAMEDYTSSDEAWKRAKTIVQLHKDAYIFQLFRNHIRNLRRYLALARFAKGQEDEQPHYDLEEEKIYQRVLSKRAEKKQIEPTSFEDAFLIYMRLKNRNPDLTAYRKILEGAGHPSKDLNPENEQQSKVSASGNEDVKKPYVQIAPHNSNVKQDDANDLGAKGFLNDENREAV